MSARAGLKLAALTRRFQGLSDGVLNAAEQAVQEASRRARDRASALAPVGDGSDGGHLRDCIRAEVVREGDDIVGRVAAENPHAAYVEFGTGRRGAGSPAPPKWEGAGSYGQQPGMPAQPYLMPAMAEGRQAFLEDAARRVREAIANRRGGNG